MNATTPQTHHDVRSAVPVGLALVIALLAICEALSCQPGGLLSVVGTPTTNAGDAA